MKILHLNSNYDRSTIYKNMNLHFREKLSDYGRVYFPTRHPYNPKNIEKSYLDIRANVGKFDMLLPKKRSKKSYQDLSTLYNVDEFNFVLAYSLFSNGYLAYEIFKRHNIPYYVLVQNTDVNVHFKKVPFSRRKGNKILENAAKVIFISEAYKSRVIDQYVDQKELIRDKSVVIPFGIDDFWQENANTYKERSKKSDTLNLIYVGKLNKNKNVATTVKALDILNSEGHNAKLTIVGTIEDKVIGERILKHNNITWHPYVNNSEELLQLYRSNDIFVMPSYKESFGLVYGEAMSQGLPIIYTKGQGFDQHFIDGEVGYSVNPDNANEIKDRILNIVENYTEISAACTNRVSKLYWTNICEIYKELF